MVTEQLQNPSGPVCLTVQQNFNSTPKCLVTEIRKIVSLATVNAIQVGGDVHQLGSVFHKVGVNHLLFRLRIHIEASAKGPFSFSSDRDVGDVIERF